MKKYNTTHASYVAYLANKEDKIIQQNRDHTSDDSAKFLKYKFDNNSLHCLTENSVDNTPNFSPARNSDDYKFSPLDITNNNNSLTVKIPITENGFGKNINSEEKDSMKNYNWTINFLIKYNSIDQPINLTFNFVLDSKDEKIPASDNDDVLVEKHYKISDAEFSIQSNSSSSVQINYSTCNEYNEIITIGSKGLLENTNDNYDGN